MRVSAVSCPSAARPGLDHGNMNPLKRLKLFFNPPKIDDPDFGQLRFMYIFYFTVVKLSGFDVECPLVSPVEWNVGFQAIDNRLEITIPFVDNEPSEAIVDT